MKSAWLVLALVVACCSAVPVIPLDRPFSGHFPTAHFNSTDDVIPGEYIVSLAAGSDLQQSILAAEAEASAKSSNFHLMDQYQFGAFTGYAAAMDADAAEALKTMAGVTGVEPNRKVYASQSCTSQKEAVWGLVRTAETNLLLNGIYPYSTEGYSDVDVYVIDTGIYTAHEDFDGKASFGFDAVDGALSKKTDGNGHGTHVAGTIMSKTWGLAKGASAIAIRVLGDDGSGTNAGVISGIEWAANQAKKTKKPSVANLSLGGGFSKAMNDAVNAAVATGLHMVVAAGNSADDACAFSPASANDVFTVGATDNKDAMSYFSNFGDCVDIFAPGSAITSTWIGGPSATNTISGTSMAAPHVAGVVAKILQKQPTLTPKAMIALIKEQSTKDKVTGLTADSPNELLYSSCA